MDKLLPLVKKSKSGHDVTIRQARTSDAQSLLDLGRSIVREDIYQLLTISELAINLETETEWIGAYTLVPNRIILVAEINGLLVGELDFCNGLRNRISHTGEMGMSVAKEFRVHGIGTLLVQTLIDWASIQDSIEKISLNVHSTNTRAISLYKKMGFEVEGIKRKEIKYGPDNYVDTLMMARFV